MAANFWVSSHQKQLKTKEELERTSNLRDKLELQLTSEDIRRIKMHFVTEIQNLGKKLFLRQRVIASAIVYMRRFYSKCSFKDHSPLLIAPTCLYISSKVEECSIQSPAYKISGEMKKLDNTWPYTTNDVLMCEFYILECLQFFLIVYHPYRSLIDYLSDCKLSKGPMDMAWNLLNDSYCTELSLTCSPYIIALAAIYIASTVCEVDLRGWFSELNVEMREVMAASSELLEYYESIKRMEKERALMTPISALLARIPAKSSQNTSHPMHNNTSYGQQRISGRF
ncbi:hypothetical protein PROFUN_11652 [Planoprotostelium fungivorum]|uniref:Cyclin-like domain-containing protein n=1 Tax=Planoprotostelium fungivorum TaxID=1890364 RepID=A0A2P6N9R9_9EUKA|nr:hypothetical protein PROFUN_11652 [Planoprotostelium fungivorum]